MPRINKPGRRCDRPGWWSKINGVKTLIADDGVSFADATKALHQLLAADKPRVRVGLTVLDACNLWLAHVEKTCKRETYQHRVTMVSVVCDTLGSLRISQLTPGLVKEFLAGAMHQRATKNPRPVSNETKRGYVIVLKAALRWAKREGHWSGDDPLADFKAPKRTRRERTLTPDERGLVLAAVPAELRALLEFLSVTGCRPHIAMQLEARHIDWHARTAVVESKDAAYTLVLPDRAMESLKQLAKQRPTGPLFRNTRGEPWTRNAVRCQLGRASRKLGIPQVVSYTYRHSFATDLLEDGQNPAVVAALMGHKDLSMLSGYYSHLAKRRGALRQAAEHAAESISARGAGQGGQPAPEPAAAPRSAPRTRSRRKPAP